MSANILYAKAQEGVTKKLMVKKAEGKSYHDRSSNVLPELEIGQEVRVAWQRNKTLGGTYMCREAVRSLIYGRSQYTDHTSKQRGFEAQERHRPS